MGGVSASPLPGDMEARVAEWGTTVMEPTTNAAARTARRANTMHLLVSDAYADDAGAHAAKQARRRWANDWTAGRSISIMCRAQSRCHAMGDRAGSRVHRSTRMPWTGGRSAQRSDSGPIRTC